MPQEQLQLPYGPVRNSNLFSNHWLEKRLPREPEWNELRPEAQGVLENLGEIWRQQGSRVALYGDEQGLEQAFIQPILLALGWKLKYQTFLRGGKPDYALFLDDAALDAALAAGRESPEFWKHATLVADAKAWERSLDRPQIIQQKREYPPEQIRRYLLDSELPFAILTNGRQWRLIPREHSADQPRFVTFMECDLAELLDLVAGRQKPGRDGPGSLFEPVDLFLRFYLFFSPAGFRTVAGRDPVVTRAAKGSSEYRQGVGEGLKQRVFKALEICIEGFLSHAPNQLDPQRDMALCRENSFTLLYRLLFIMYAEDRGLLPYKINRLYTENRSLGKWRDEIATARDRVKLHDGKGDYPLASTQLWQGLGYLFDLVNNGKRYGVPAYNGGLFDPDKHPFLEEKALSDRYLSHVIDQLGRAPDKQVGLARVDYRDLAIQHLGGIYEGLLELHPHCATEPVAVVRREGRDDGEEKTQPAKADLPKGFEVVHEYKVGQVYLLNNKGERRASGSYYTPNHIVDYIVEKTLGPICSRIGRQLHKEIQEVQEALKGTRNGKRQALQAKLDKLSLDFDDRVLALRVCDPAMGSGHFLLRVCQYLAEEIATNPNTGDPGGMAANNAATPTDDEPTLTYWKRRIVEHCIYGVDLNPVAVELAKLALWLETAAVDRPLTFLDHHLRCGNSLVGADIEGMGTLPGETIPGRGLLGTLVAARLPGMLESLAQIAAIPSEDVEQIKEKERIYRKVFNPDRAPLLLAADVWCSRPFLTKAKDLTPNRYQDLINSLDEPSRLRKIAAEPWLQTALAAAHDEAVNCFHWQLEFPEVFFDASGLRDGGGFDAIVGNPPWGHAEQLEALRSLGVCGAAADDNSECFVCRAVSLVSVRSGRVGLVLPDTLLSPAKRGIRRLMLSKIQTEEVMNIGPDWFGNKVRMSTVLWQGFCASEPSAGYQFHSCVLPISTRKRCQAGRISLEAAILDSKRSASAAECLADEDVSIPLFGSDAAVEILWRVTTGAETLSILCEHGRGVELNKNGNAIQCPKCGSWDAPPLRDDAGGFRDKTCTHCGRDYRVTTETPVRVLVSDIRGKGKEWRQFIDGDSIKRYSSPLMKWIDVSATGINYKPVRLYDSPKVLIRQAGIGVNAVLDASSSAYCPQSVYVYRVQPEVRKQGFDEVLLTSLLCSRLFHLQVFTSFGEIDSSRAFSKLTHTRLANMRLIPLGAVRQHPRHMARIRQCVNELCSDHESIGREELDWDIEGCWSVALNLSEGDIRNIMLNFCNVHQNETLLSFFPGGFPEGIEPWVRRWAEAMNRVREGASSSRRRGGG